MESHFFKKFVWKLKILEFYTHTLYYTYLFREEAHIIVYIWKVVFFFYHVEYRDQIQVIRLGNKSH